MGRVVQSPDDCKDCLCNTCRRSLYAHDSYIVEHESVCSNCDNCYIGVSSVIECSSECCNSMGYVWKCMNKKDAKETSCVMSAEEAQKGVASYREENREKYFEKCMRDIGDNIEHNVKCGLSNCFFYFKNVEFIDNSELANYITNNLVHLGYTVHTKRTDDGKLVNIEIVW